MPALTRVRSRAGAGRNVASAYDPDAQAYFAWAGITDALTKTAVDALILALKAASIWDAYDVLIPHANQDSTAGCFNLIKNDHHAVIINATTFTQYEGFTGNASNMGLDIDYNPSTDMVAAGANSFGMSAYVRNDRTTDTGSYMAAMACLGGAPNFGDIGLYPWGGQIVIGAVRNVGHFNSTAPEFRAATPATSRGLHQISRTGTTASEYHINGVSKATSAGTNELLPNSSVGLLCQKLFNGGRQFFSPDQVSISAFRRGFNTTEASAETGAFKTYMAVLGKDVLP